jgi:hypothetical protein
MSQAHTRPRPARPGQHRPEDTRFRCPRDPATGHDHAPQRAQRTSFYAADLVGPTRRRRPDWHNDGQHHAKHQTWLTRTHTEPPIWSARPGPVAAILPRLNGCSVHPGSAILRVNVMAIAAAVTALRCALPNPLI